MKVNVKGSGIRRRWLGLLLLGALLLGSLTLGGCGEAAEALKTVQANGTLRVALLKDNAPYSYEVDGEARGIEAEIMRAVAKQLGVAVSFVFADDQQDVINRLSLGEVELGGAMFYQSVVLERSVNTSVSYLKQPIFAVTARGAFFYTKDSFTSKSVGMFSGVSELMSIELNSISTAELISYQAIDTVERDITEGTIDAYFCYRDQAYVLMESEALQAQTVTGIRADELVLAGKVGESTELMAVVNDVIAQMVENGEIVTLLQNDGVASDTDTVPEASTVPE